ncbi:hypothetical protein GP2143_13736 [marine gamma proteobacterium HTCC2143]|uniref:Uncharacterized protein n=1 Tax=marine gamma proteobacterium HTCC2143 TaxID=247633 RepID=A0Y867_9GAMM|nr:hypothetical protein GP2143_13736 [marine gamma proteobacterium HTCC2143]
MPTLMSVMFVFPEISYGKQAFVGLYRQAHRFG